MPRVPPAVLLPRELQRVEREAGRGVADRMDVDDEPFPIRGRHHLLQVIRVPQELAAIVGPVRVRLEEIGGLALDDAVDEDLHRVDLEEAAFLPLPVGDELLDALDRVVRRKEKRAAEPNAELSLALEPLVGDHVGGVVVAGGREPDGGDAHGGDAVLRRHFLEGRKPGHSLFDGERRNDGGNEPGRALPESPRRLPGRWIALDDAALRVRRIPGDSGELERLRVHPGRVSIARAELHRPVGDDAVEVRLLRTGQGEERVRPPASADGLLLGMGLGETPNRLEVLIERPQVVEADGHRLDERARRMRVAVDESRDDHLPFELDDLGLRSYEGLDSRVVADVQDRAASDGEGLRAAPGRVLSVDGAVSEHPVGFGSTSAGGKEQ